MFLLVFTTSVYYWLLPALALILLRSLAAVRGQHGGQRSGQRDGQRSGQRGGELCAPRGGKQGAGCTQGADGVAVSQTPTTAEVAALIRSSSAEMLRKETQRRHPNPHPTPTLDPP